MIAAMGASSGDICQAVLTLSRSIAGRTDLDALLSGVCESVGRIVRYDHVGLILHDSREEVMQGHIMNAPGNPAIRSLRLPVDQDPAGWVWLNQQPLIIPRLDLETRWPAFVNRARHEFGISTMMLVPLTAGESRLGAFGFSSVEPLDPGQEELAFLERVASEFAVAVEAFLAKQAVVRERDRLQTVFDISNALVSKLVPDELFSAISDQLSRIMQHDYAILTLCNEKTGTLDPYALHAKDCRLFEEFNMSFDPEGMPAAEVLATGKPVVAYSVDIHRYPSPVFQRAVALGCKSICSVPLISRDRTLGTLALVRTSEVPWPAEDVEFLMQVGCQIAIAVENSLAYRELAEMKERLATEKLY
ncbi:MAG TPA: GAF domain-containing protein, partial [Bryobacteraceae bacterium]|nr:GAF domain-containing protein [Bryobacteraceae bacterium]